MAQRVAALLVLVLVSIPGVVSAGEPGPETLLTSGTVSDVDLGDWAVVLDNGYKLRPHVILRDNVSVELRSVRVGDTVFVTGVSLGFQVPVTLSLSDLRLE